jgi:hypothetical protein
MRNKSTQDRQQSRQQSQQDDRRPQQGRDPQRNKQSDSGRGGQQGSTQPSPKGGRQQGQQSDAATSSGGQKSVYGEGNYAASKQYNDATRDFAQSGRVDEAARNAAPQSDAEALQMQAAEAEGKRHAKGEDPALNRKQSNVGPGASRAPKPGEEE